VIGNRETGEFISDYKPLVMELGKKVMSLL